jgi:AraC family transcriptional regulator of adaptative response/methylated-DNA-[protein]-cysteine methyltransferase
VLQRLFRRWAGISPKRFLQFLTKEYAKGLLENSNLLDASYEAGLSGPGRLHDLFVACEAMSPGEYKQKGKGLVIDYGFHPSPFGLCFIALTGRGICGLSFIEGVGRPEIPKSFYDEWQNATFRQDQKKTFEYVKAIFSPKVSREKKSLKVLCRGTNFQIKIWEALLRIPSGTAVTYTDVARMAGCPRAVRAAGTAIGKNPIAYLIPCHRVIRGVGAMGGYRWGLARKRMILGVEAVQSRLLSHSQEDFE